MSDHDIALLVAAAAAIASLIVLRAVIEERLSRARGAEPLRVSAERLARRGSRWR